MSTHQQQADPLTSFWRDWFAQMQAQAAGAQTHAQHAAAHAQPHWPMTPDAVKQMQSAYLDALARYADQYMRSPQFLDAMKKSLDQALAFRKQVDTMLKDSASGAFTAATGGTSAEILTAVRQAESRLNERLDDISGRIDRLERGGRGSPRSGATPKKKTKKKASRKGAKAG